MKAPKWAGVMGALGIGSAAIVARPSRAGHELTTLRALYGLERPSSLDASHTALVLIDFQGEFVGGRLLLTGTTIRRFPVKFTGEQRG